MPRATSGRVHRLTIEPPAYANMIETPIEALHRVLQAGQRVNWYGREWIVGPVSNARGILAGRIGVRGADTTAELWDEKREDFVSAAHPVGLTAPFAVRLRDMQLMVQPRGQEISLNGFISAFAALLTSTTGDRWRVQGSQRRMSFEDWRATVTRVTSVRLTVRVPNPHWPEEEDLKALMDHLEADSTTLEARSEGGLDTDADFLRQTRTHSEADYGDGRYTGVREVNGQSVESNYVVNYGSEDEAVEVPVDPDTGEVEPDSLRDVLESVTEEGDTDTDDGDTDPTD